MKKIILLLCLFSVLLTQAQTRTAWVAAKSGLSIREKPAIGAKVLDKIPYGTKLSILNTDEELVAVVTEGMRGYWEKVTFNNKTGYIVGSYLLPVAPPKLSTVKEMADHCRPKHEKFSSLKVLSDKGFSRF